MMPADSGASHCERVCRRAALPTAFLPPHPASHYISPHCAELLHILTELLHSFTELDSLTGPLYSHLEPLDSRTELDSLTGLLHSHTELDSLAEPLHSHPEPLDAHPEPLHSLTSELFHSGAFEQLPSSSVDFVCRFASVDCILKRLIKPCSSNILLSSDWQAHSKPDSGTDSQPDSKRIPNRLHEDFERTFKQDFILVHQTIFLILKAV